MDNTAENKKVKFSVLLITYNQGEYIEETINSILNQTCQDFEIVVSDDCSSDNTLDVVRSIKNDKIKITQTPYNMGINGNVNNAVKNSSGEYVIFFSGDDKFRPHFLEKLNNILNKDPSVDIIFTNGTFIDSNGACVGNKDKAIFDYHNISREQVIHQMFMKTNKLSSVGMTVNRDVVMKIFPFDNSLVAHQDFSSIVQLILNQENKFTALNDINVEYRRFCDNRNVTCNQDGIVKLRISLETDVLMDKFLSVTDLGFLQTIFNKEIKETNIIPFEDTIPFFLGQMAILSSDKDRQSWGYKTIAKFISGDEGYNIVHNRYGFTFKDFLGLVKKINGTSKADFYTKYKQYKKLFDMTIIFTGVIIFLLSFFIIFNRFFM